MNTTDQPALDYAGTPDKAGDPVLRKAAFWFGLTPIVLGAAATAGILATNHSFFDFLAIFALAISLFSVPFGVLFLIVHACSGFPEADGRNGIRRTVIATAVVSSVGPIAYGCWKILSYSV